jgi:PAS domain S-box-containing protein
MTEGSFPERVRVRIGQVLDILAHVSFGNLEVSVPELPDQDEFGDLFTGLGVLVADLREAREELEALVEQRTKELEEDIRQRECVEAKLGASEATYQMLVETSPDPIVLCDLKGRIRMANPALRREFRAEQGADLVGAAWIDFVVVEDRARAAECLVGMADSTGFHAAEVRFRRCDGSEFVGELRCSTVRDATGASAGVLTVIRDVTEQRQREREQLRAEHLESLGTVAGGIAHDFNNCLAAITGCLSMVVDQVRADSEARELLASAMDAAYRATALTRQLLTFSKGGVPVKACVHLGGLVERVGEFCVRGSNVRCLVEMATDLWPVEVDTGQFEQVLGNLVINAKQAMPDGGSIVVRAANAMVAHPETADRERRHVCITVRDFGAGIPAQNLRRIYDPYFSTKQGGTGLGLATAYSVVRKHGGFLDCESTVGEGSTFSIYLPASEEQPEAAPMRGPALPHGSGRVLVMDDERLVRELAARLLAKAGYEVTAVESGSAALAAYRDARDRGQPYAVVVMDLTVPGGGGGKETMRELLAFDPAAKGIVVSGYSDDPVLADHQAYGFAAALAKPYRPDELLGVVAAITGQAE